MLPRQIFFRRAERNHHGSRVAAVRSDADDATLVSSIHSDFSKASFYDLCGQPLGPADYLAIADAIRLLILEDIPRLSSENYNQARRFVTLVDALYEARVRLIANAADEPEKLYLEGAGSFEFERTASRLREMQAADWGTDQSAGTSAST